MSISNKYVTFDGRTKKPLNEPGKEGWRNLIFVDPDALKDPMAYQASSGLAAAVNVALTLGMPLLITGEPGCGKSQLAARLVWELGFPQTEPETFVIKSDTESRDLFYRFDTLGHFHAAQSSEKNTDPRRFVRFHALGKAILWAIGKENFPSSLGDKMLHGTGEDNGLKDWPDKPTRLVVLIDEIDKAPREVPNDILTEIETMKFHVPELGLDAPIGLDMKDTKQAKRHRPVVIITSNGERDLPQAFLRRCVYWHVDLPDYGYDEKGEVTRTDDGTIYSIVMGRLGVRFDGAGKADNRNKLLREALSLYRYLRKEAGLKHKPSVAELLNWLEHLSAEAQVRKTKVPQDESLRSHSRFEGSLTALLKVDEDRIREDEILKEWSRSLAPKSVG